VERAPATPLPLPDTARRQSTTAAAIAPLLRPSRTAQAAPAAPPAQPEVNITIGRVELRAAPPPPAPAAPMRTAPRVSLDDYLQSRGGPRP
jgi:hypothetical protein